MHVKELLFTQKLERNQAAQVLEQKRALSDQLDATQAETRSLKHALQLEKSTTASMEARMRQADDGIGSLTLARGNPSQASLEHVNSQINSLKALNDDLWERLHAANKERADAAERHQQVLHEREATIEHLRARVAKLTEEESLMWDQAAQVETLDAAAALSRCSNVSA